MAFPSRAALLFAGVLLVVLAAAPAAEAGAGGGSVCFDRVFSFGDSLTDTGNFLLSVPDDFPDPARNLPYGQTFFGRPSGRYSDGRNLLDFFGNLFPRRPTLSPYLTYLFVISACCSFSPSFVLINGDGISRTFSVRIQTLLLLHGFSPYSNNSKIS
jgi:hypothetical protein